MDRVFIGILCLVSVFAGALADNEQPKANSSQVQENPICEACVKFGGEIQKEITQNKIDTFFKNVCNGKTGIVHKFCSAVISRFEEFVAHIDVHKACDDLLVCSKWANILAKILQDPEGALKEVVQMVQKILTKVVDEIKKFDPFKVFIPQLCKLCKAFVDTIDKDVHPAEIDVIKFVDRICHRLPPPTDMACVDNLNATIEKYWDDVFAKPEKVCDFLHMCP